ncbi:transporter substrate-binding domain-containing protein [Caulobacter sp. S45]|uniref:transporter substrate-binding domain-containing protein n=1 Tax=Caulobacter sp. S45 TaxID=1641861 RepID=UPI00131D1945|nr:transporter substrate-binding domain-containing protein [Caulobacter sp. S45]
MVLSASGALEWDSEKLKAAANSLAPRGRLRAAINFGNGVLAQRGPDGGPPRGVSVQLATELARRLDVPLDLVTFEAAGKVFAALSSDVWDIAFLANEPERAKEVDFTSPYVSIDATYLVAADSPYRAVADLDQPHVVVAVGKGAAYDLYLSRTLKHATLVRAPTSSGASDMFLESLASGSHSDLSAAAGVRQALDDAAKGRSDVRVLGEAFTSVEQAMATPRGRESGSAYLCAFIDEVKAAGFVRQALDATGQTAARVS